MSAVKERIGNAKITSICVAVKALEAWFLADSTALLKWLGVEIVELKPEGTEGMPWLRLKELSRLCNARGPGPSKPVFAKKYIKKCGFSLERAASHPYCESSLNFVDTLRAFGLSQKGQQPEQSV